MSVRGNSDVDRRHKSARITTAIVLLVTLILVAAAATVIVAGPQLLARTLSAPVALPSGFTDRTSPTAVAEKKAQDRDNLDSYGWVDKEAGVAHIPVAEAIQRLAETGLAVGAPTAASEPVATVPTVVSREISYQNDLLPLFTEHCGECHGAEDPEEGLELTTYRTLMLGSIYGAVIKAGDAEGSYLIEMVSSGKMPKRGDPLTPDQIALIRAWIDAGALDN